MSLKSHSISCLTQQQIMYALVPSGNIRFLCCRLLLKMRRVCCSKTNEIERLSMWIPKLYLETTPLELKYRQMNTSKLSYMIMSQGAEHDTAAASTPPLTLSIDTKFSNNLDPTVTCCCCISSGSAKALKSCQYCGLLPTD